MNSLENKVWGQMTHKPPDKGSSIPLTRPLVVRLAIAIVLLGAGTGAMFEFFDDWRGQDGAGSYPIRMTAAALTFALATLASSVVAGRFHFFAIIMGMAMGLSSITHWRSIPVSVITAIFSGAFAGLTIRLHDRIYDVKQPDRE